MIYRAEERAARDGVLVMRKKLIEEMLAVGQISNDEALRMI